MDYEDIIEDDGSEKPAASLKARTLIWIGVSVTFFMAIAALLLIYSTKQEMEQAQRTRVNLLTTIQADALAMPLWDYDDTQIKQILSALKRDPDYLGSIVINYDKKSDTTEYKDGNPMLIAGAYAVEREISRMSGEEQVKLGKLTVFVTRNSIEHLFWQQVKASIAAVVVLQFLILGAIYLALRMFTVPLDTMTKAMLALARGDKTIEVPARKRQDEIGRMAAAVQTFKDTAIHADLMDAEQRAEQQRKERRLKKQELLIEDFNQTTSAVMSGVSQATTRTFDTVGTLSHMADDLSLRSQEAMHASHQAAVTVQSVAAAAEELSASIGEISRQVQMSIQTVNDAVEGANEADVTVKSLTEAASKIGSIVEMIHEISEQVSLLALNATIEAARAGPAGKGFAVVASEVKGLATQTAAATDEITRYINTIQSVSGDTAAVIQAIVTTIRQVHEIAASIGSAVEEQGQATLEIARNVQITAAANQEVNESMIVVNEAVFKTRNSADDMQKAATDLQQQIRQLETGITTFLTGIRSE